MSETFTLAVQTQDDSERQRILSIFQVMQPQLQYQWQLAPVNQAQVVVLDADDPGSDYFLASCRELAGAVPILMGSSNPLTAEWFLQKPVRVHELVSLMRQLEDYLKVRQRRHDTEPGHNPDSARVFRMFEQMKAQPGCYRVDITPTSPLHYNSESDDILLPRELLVTGHSLGAFELLAHCIRQRCMSAITPERFRTISKDQRFAKVSREALIWNWTIPGHPESQPTPANANTRFQLTRWPNLAALPHTASHLKLCQYFSQQTGTVHDACDVTGIAAVTVQGFCTACEAMGLMQVMDVVDNGQQRRTG